MGRFDRSGLRLFEAPGGGDWILVIDDETRGLPAPGRPALTRSPSND